MIRLADHLEALRNFNTLMAVVAGLNNSSVMRLKHTYSEVKKKLRTVGSILAYQPHNTTSTHGLW